MQTRDIELNENLTLRFKFLDDGTLEPLCDLIDKDGGGIIIAIPSERIIKALISEKIEDEPEITVGDDRYGT